MVSLVSYVRDLDDTHRRGGYFLALLARKISSGDKGLHMYIYLVMQGYMSSMRTLYLPMNARCEPACWNVPHHLTTCIRFSARRTLSALSFSFEHIRRLILLVFLLPFLSPSGILTGRHFLCSSLPRSCFRRLKERPRRAQSP